RLVENVAHVSTCSVDIQSTIEHQLKLETLSETSATSLSIDRKCDQHVSWPAPRRRIPGIHVKHPAADSRTGAIHGAPVPGNSVHSWILAVTIEIPNNLAITNRIGPKMPVDRSGESHTRNCRHGRRLRRATPRFIAALSSRSVPDLFAVSQSK